MTHIEAVSEDWWSGTEPNGGVGLFHGEHDCTRVTYSELMSCLQRTTWSCRSEHGWQLNGRTAWKLGIGQVLVRLIE